MERIRAIASAIVVAAMLSAGYPAAAADTAPSATITMKHDSGGIGIGWHKGEGKLTLRDGSEYAVTMDAYSVIGLGFANVTSTGKVYNLEKATDLSGNYTGTGLAATFQQGEGRSTLKNSANKVRIEMVSSQTGVRAAVGAGSVGIKLGKRLKGPKAPAPVAAAPAPIPVKTAPMPVAAPKPVITPIPIAAPKATNYTLNFGFNKARVNRATNRMLDSVLADWKDKNATFYVVGHADMVGSKKNNLRLSRKRAAAVKRAMVKKGIPASRIVAVGVGQQGLAVPTKRGKRLRANRRVVLTVVKSK